MKLIDKVILIEYETGQKYKVNYISNKKLKWEGLAGNVKGYSSEENCHIISPTKNIFFVSWLEKNGTSISQLLDFNKNKITTYMTFNKDKGRKGELRNGKIGTTTNNPS